MLTVDHPEKINSMLKVNNEDDPEKLQVLHKPHTRQKWDSQTSVRPAASDRKDKPTPAKKECSLKPLPGLRWALPVDLRYPEFKGGVIIPQCEPKNGRRRQKKKVPRKAKEVCDDDDGEEEDDYETEISEVDLSRSKILMYDSKADVKLQAELSKSKS